MLKFDYWWQLLHFDVSVQQGSTNKAWSKKAVGRIAPFSFWREDFSLQLPTDQ
jgi:hypothetical protein